MDIREILVRFIGERWFSGEAFPDRRLDDSLTNLEKLDCATVLSLEVLIRDHLELSLIEFKEIEIP